MLIALATAAVMTVVEAVAWVLRVVTTTVVATTTVILLLEHLEVLR